MPGDALVTLARITCAAPFAVPDVTRA